jgi:hypothetical protein
LKKLGQSPPKLMKSILSMATVQVYLCNNRLTVKRM